MKRLLFTTLILLIGINFSPAQNITNEQFALTKYNIKISDEFREDLKPINSFIQDTEVRSKNKDDKLKSIMVHHIYYHLKSRFERELDIDIIPRNTFGDNADYDEYGYPKINISKALRKGSASFYFKVNVEINSKTKERIDNDPDLEKIDKEIFFPHIITKVTIFNDEGIIPVAKWRGEKITYDPVYVNKRLFRGFIEDANLPPKPQLKEGETEQKSLFDLYDETIDEMINSFLSD
jgi:hypothetical protein